MEKNIIFHCNSCVSNIPFDKTNYCLKCTDELNDIINSNYYTEVRTFSCSPCYGAIKNMYTFENKKTIIKGVISSFLANGARMDTYIFKNGAYEEEFGHYLVNEEKVQKFNMFEHTGKKHLITTQQFLNEVKIGSIVQIDHKCDFYNALEIELSEKSLCFKKLDFTFNKNLVISTTMTKPAIKL